MLGREIIFSKNGLRANLLRGGIGSLVLKSISTPLGLLLAVLLARLLGPEGYGVYSYIFALVSLLAIPAQFGLPTLIVRETAKSQANEDWALMKGVWRWSTYAAIILSILCIIIGGAIVLLFPSHRAAFDLNTFVWGLALIPLIVLGNLRGAALRGLRKVVQGQLPEKALRPGFFILMLLGAILMGQGHGLTSATAMEFHVIAAGLAFIIGAWQLSRERPPELTLHASSHNKTRAWISAIVPLALLGGIQFLNRQAGILMLGVLSTPENVGLYRVVTQGSLLVLLGQQAVNITVAPQLSRLYTQCQGQKLQRLVTISSRVSLLLAGPAMLLFLCLGQPILGTVFGDAYRSADKALYILSIACFITTWFGPISFLLTMTGHERVTTYIVGLSALLNIMLNLFLIPRLGIEGAALAFSISLIAWHMGLREVARKKLNVVSSPISKKHNIPNLNK